MNSIANVWKDFDQSNGMVNFEQFKSVIQNVAQDIEINKQAEAAGDDTERAENTDG